jgi:L-ribulose-5-phosphate 3-epimerase
LQKSGYRGPYLIEMWSETAADPMQEVRNARAWVVDKMQKAGLNMEETA